MGCLSDGLSQRWAILSGPAPPHSQPSQWGGGCAGSAFAPSFLFEDLPPIGALAPLGRAHPPGGVQSPPSVQGLCPVLRCERWPCLALCLLIPLLSGPPSLGSLSNRLVRQQWLLSAFPLISKCLPPSGVPVPELQRARRVEGGDGLLSHPRRRDVRRGEGRSSLLPTGAPGAQT